MFQFIRLVLYVFPLSWSLLPQELSIEVDLIRVKKGDPAEEQLAKALDPNLVHRRLDRGEMVTLRFPTRAKNRREFTLHVDEVAFFDATLPHQVANPSKQNARLFISRNYDFDSPHEQPEPNGEGDLDDS